MHAPDLTAQPMQGPDPHQSLRARTFNARSLRSFRKLFLILPHPQTAELTGLFQAEFVGPGWLRASAPKALVLGGLGGWWGKAFTADGQGVNIVQRDGSLAHIMPVRLGLADSTVDRRPCLAVTYPAGSPFPWPHVVDELRYLDDHTLLGLTILKIAPLNRLAFPFLLHHSPNLPIAHSPNHPIA